MIRKLKGANLDIDFSNPTWAGATQCPWNVAENTKEHKCAVKDISLCAYFHGIKYPDTVLCTYKKPR